MSDRKIPPVGTPEAERVIERVKRGEVEAVGKGLGFANLESFKRRLRAVYGIYERDIPRPTDLEEEKIKYVPYPEIKLTPFKQPKSNRDEEDIGLVIADPHLGKITSNYNLDVATARLDFLLDSAMSIINLHRPIRRAYIFMLGDIVQGENAFQGSRLGTTSKGAYEQIHEDAVPLITKFCLSLAQGVSSVDVYGVRGNHGKYAREAPEKTNWDRFFYKSLADAMVNQKSVKVYPASEFYQLINIRGFRFFLIHGDQARGNAGVPVIALRRKMQEWFSYVKGFNYAYAGHFHTGYFDQVNTNADYTISPPLVTGDEWAIEMIGRASEPKQLCFGIHNKYGRTFKYDLHTDNAFLPNKFLEPEGEVKV